MSSKTYPKIREVLFFVLKIFLFQSVTFENDFISALYSKNLATTNVDISISSVSIQYSI
jgi:hypothetical protein